MQVRNMGLRALACAVLAAGSGMAAAQGTGEAWPVRPVTIVVPYPPGGSTDPEARIYAQKLNENTGQQFLIENKGGAGTTIGTGQVAKSPPNGYMMLMVNPTIAMMSIAYKSLPFDVEIGRAHV